jgi:phosphoglucomutase
MPLGTLRAVLEYPGREAAHDDAALREALSRLTPQSFTRRDLAGETVRQVLTEAPAGGPIGGVKVVAEGGWFAVRPSGTEDVYKLYCESFRSPEHLNRIEGEARDFIATVTGGRGR